MSEHHELPSTGFPTSTVFTLGTADGIILIRMHTVDNDLYLFGTFVQRGNFDIGLHWTTWRPRPDGEAIDIDHEAIVVPVDNEEPILRLPVQYQQFQHPPMFHPHSPTHHTVHTSSSREDSSPPEELPSVEESPLEANNPTPPIIIPNPTLFVTNPDPNTSSEEEERYWTATGGINPDQPPSGNVKAVPRQ